MSRYTSMEHLRFLLFDVHRVQDLFAYEYFSHLDIEQVAMMVDAAKALADRDMYPFFREMDEQPVHYAGKGVVWSHPQLRTIIQNAAEQSWIGGESSFDLGGLQLPQMVYNAAHHIFQAANNGTQGYISLTTGAARLIINYGTPEQISTFVPPMFDGRWQGTMALTEPQAGSSLTDITTVATPTDAGYYLIKGQ
ncbi:MAG: acyl-CoA dehydrogenase family protein, partial [Saprospiraceae bacterium]|nr:acyl-CoA dehydrogenase family protein [Saprospiraceae bacterium]